MAFFLLFTGLLLGTTAVALSEAERDRYYDTRSYTMTYLGTKDGAEVWQDNRTGQFFVDDGWDVSRVGTSGFVPHPVDRDHLKALCQKFNPGNLPWVNFLLASFEGKTDTLWWNFFEKYMLGPKPKEPTWGKGIRKARWSQYGEQLEAYEAKKKELTPQYKKELEQWAQKRKQYDEEHASIQAASVGQALLQRALSTPGLVLNNTVQYKATIPPNVGPGQTFMVNCNGQNILVAVPEGALPGSTISFMGPGPAPAMVPVAMAEVVAPPLATTTAAPPPPAMVAAPPPPPVSTVPPPPPAAIKKESSMTW